MHVYTKRIFLKKQRLSYFSKGDFPRIREIISARVWILAQERVVYWFFAWIAACVTSNLISRRVIVYPGWWLPLWRIELSIVSLTLRTMVNAKSSRLMAGVRLKNVSPDRMWWSIAEPFDFCYNIECLASNSVSYIHDHNRNFIWEKSGRENPTRERTRASLITNTRKKRVETSTEIRTTTTMTTITAFYYHGIVIDRNVMYMPY